MSESKSNQRIGGQADDLRRFATGITMSERREKVLLVAGAKGGVGTTAITLAVARDLAERAGPTMVTSACPGRSDLEFMAGVPAAVGTRSDSKPINNRLVLFRTAVSNEPDATSFATKALERLPEEGWLVIDAGSATSAWCHALGPMAGRLLLVTTPDDLSRINAYGAIKQLHEAGVLPPLGVVVNHAADAEAANATANVLASSSRRFLKVDAPLAGWLATASGDPTQQTIETASRVAA